MSSKTITQLKCWVLGIPMTRKEASDVDKRIKDLDIATHKLVSKKIRDIARQEGLKNPEDDPFVHDVEDNRSALNISMEAFNRALSAVNVENNSPGKKTKRKNAVVNINPFKRWIVAEVNVETGKKMLAGPYKTEADTNKVISVYYQGRNNVQAITSDEFNKLSLPEKKAVPVTVNLSKKGKKKTE